MGGYGALALAMRHSDAFGAVYALSPGLFAPGGLAESQMYADPTVVADFIAGQDELSQMSPHDAAGELPRVMGRSGIPNRLETFEGGHGPAGPRAGEVMLRFFTEMLDPA